MKNLIWIVFLALIGSNSATGQDNILKANLLSFGVTSPNVTYERVLSDNMSVTLGLSGTISFRVPITGTATVSGVERTETARARFRGFGITPGFRFYTGGNGPEGFYLEPFIRYYKYKITVDDYPYERSSFETVLVDGAGSLRGIGGGIVIGSQMLTKGKLTIDFNGGFGLASGKLDLVTEDEDLSPQEFADIENDIRGDLESSSVGFFNDFEVSSTDSKASAIKEGALLPIIRLGVSLGWSF